MSARPGRVRGLAIPLGPFLLAGIASWGWSAWRLVRGRATPAVVLSSTAATSRRADAAPRTAWTLVARLRFLDGHEATPRFPVRAHAAR